MSKNQIHIRTALDTAQIDQRAEALGFTTRNAYINHLIRTDLLDAQGGNE